jgi:hypothetical protein
MLAVGMVAGCHGLGEVEALSRTLSQEMRKWLGILRRLPDTTARDAVLTLDLDDMRALIWRSALAAGKRKALKAEVLPLNVVSMDGRDTATPQSDEEYAQKQHATNGKVYGLVRTITSVLISCRTCVCLDAHPVPAQTNEMGAFAAAFLTLLRVYGRSMIDVVTYDSGACSEANCELIRKHGVHYLMCLKDGQPTLLAEALRQLARQPTVEALAETDEILSGERVIRRLWLGFIPARFHWQRSLTVVRVYKSTEHLKSGKFSEEDHYYVSSLKRTDLTPAQWLLLIRRRWCVENDGHNTLDKIMREDTRPWLREPHGMLVMMMLRRAVYNLLALFRGRTQKNDDRRHLPWQELFAEFRLVVQTATAEHLAGLHLREVEEAAGV